METRRDERTDQPAGEQRRESGMPGGGLGRTDDVGRSGVYPASGPYPSGDAPTRGQASWGQGERGATGFADHGDSELSVPTAAPEAEHAMGGGPHVRTLRDYAEERSWIGKLGWSDDELDSVPVYEQATADDEMINLTNFGGTPLGTSANAGGGTSADASSVRNLWVYQNTTPPALWQRLRELADRGGPSGYNESGRFGEVGEAGFPPGSRGA